MSISREQITPYIAGQLSDEDVRSLIERHVECETPETGIVRARVRGRGTTVAAVIMALNAESGELEKAAAQYDLSIEQMLGVVFFYWENQGVIDAEITARNSWFTN
jgi:uncharacterized protein (DUF433 family)